MGRSKKCWFWCNGPSTKALQIPLRHQGTFNLALFLSSFGDTKKCCTFSGLELAPKSRKKLIGALSCMHKGPKCIQSLWDHPKKIPFVQKHKEGAICAILREKTPFLAFPEAKKGIVHYARLRTGLIITQIPRGYQKKKFIVWKSAICAILREKTPFLAFPEAKKGIVHCATLRKAAHWPNNNANPSGLSEKNVYCLQKRDMCDP